MPEAFVNVSLGAGLQNSTLCLADAFNPGQLEYVLRLRVQKSEMNLSISRTLPAFHCVGSLVPSISAAPSQT